MTTQSTPLSPLAKKIYDIVLRESQKRQNSKSIGSPPMYGDIAGEINGGIPFIDPAFRAAIDELKKHGIIKDMSIIKNSSESEDERFSNSVPTLLIHS